MKRKLIRDIFNNPETGLEVTIMGWVRTKRGNKNVQFIAVNDGSTIHNMQAVVNPADFEEELLKNITTGCSVSVTGRLTESKGQEQPVEIQAGTIRLFGKADTDHYPLQKKGHTMEFLREIAHLRPRTNTFGAVFRIRHAMAFAIHTFFNDRNFYYFHSPVITASDAEGAGEMFRVTTLNLNKLPKTNDGEIDFKKDFFGRETNLTVSGQLEAELAALALGLVYTFGPTFRAENSNTPRHLAEFWMIEPEMAFYDIHDNMDLAEAMLKYLIQYALDHCMDDLQFLNKMYDKELISRLQSVISSTFVRISYSEGIELLKNAKQKFEFPVDWGSDLQKEHENYLVSHFNSPVIITDYPKEIKAFYMKQNEDGKTVRAMDILFPWIGEIIGGSQREENYDKLLARMHEMRVPEKALWWYLETRKYGTVPHSGFGLGFERLILFVTGMTNIRDVIPFPRTPMNAEF
ncbi:MAG: asparagine--tRNA ligase [Bacteroidia bacterium]|nr:asparagine--tRNA ligase [Bacteroidia bacterium]MCZ2277986.1 asparagine--tRNA ligase [Bacteroidia bacterium]